MKTWNSGPRQNVRPPRTSRPSRQNEPKRLTGRFHALGSNAEGHHQVVLGSVPGDEPAGGTVGQQGMRASVGSLAVVGELVVLDGDQVEIGVGAGPRRFRGHVEGVAVENLGQAGSERVEPGGFEVGGEASQAVRLRTITAHGLVELTSSPP